MNPPSLPPPPPPPPPLNTPPSRARLQLAARLAMNKRNAAAAAAAAANGSQEKGGAPEAPSNPPTERLRNPFADDEDDEDDDLSGSDDGDVDLPSGASGSGSGGEWPRQSWWRGMVRGAGRGRGGSDKEATNRYKERFGDGRDDDSSGDDEDDEDMDDEEFGDFAMPEAAPAPPPPSGGMVSGIDPAREKILLKPTPMHPGASHGLGPKLNTSPFTSLWPFSTQSFGAKNMTPTGSGSRDDVDDIDDKTPTATPTEHHSMDDLIPIKLEEGQEEPEDVRGEDGNKIDRAVEAKSRTSIEDPDDDGEVLVGRPGGAATGAGVSGAGSGVATS